jgi:hypothetical protein
LSRQISVGNGASYWHSSQIKGSGAALSAALSGLPKLSTQASRQCRLKYPKPMVLKSLSDYVSTQAFEHPRRSVNKTDIYGAEFGASGGGRMLARAARLFSA